MTNGQCALVMIAVTLAIAACQKAMMNQAERAGLPIYTAEWVLQ